MSKSREVISAGYVNNANQTKNLVGVVMPHTYVRLVPSVEKHTHKMNI